VDLKEKSVSKSGFGIYPKCIFETNKKGVEIFSIPLRRFICLLPTAYCLLPTAYF